MRELSPLNAYVSSKDIRDCNYTVISVSNNLKYPAQGTQKNSVLYGLLYLVVLKICSTQGKYAMITSIYTYFTRSIHEIDRNNSRGPRGLNGDLGTKDQK